MAVRVYPFFRYRKTRREDERRLFMWLTASTIAHLLAITWVVGVSKPAPPSAPASVLTATLVQAVVAGPPKPETQATPEPEPVAQTPAAPVAAKPSIEQDPGPTLERHAPKTRQASVSEGTTGLPVGNITVGVLQQPAELGLELRGRLREEFPAHVAREPKLRGALVVGYPQKGLEARMNMRVLAVISIDDAGHIVETRLQPDDPWFGPPILDALKGARFTPAEQGGKRVPYWMILEVVFSVDGGAAAPRGRSP